MTRAQRRLTASRPHHRDQPVRHGDRDPPGKVIGASLYADDYTGRARTVLDEDHDCLLGVTLVGPGVEELIHSATIAVARPIGTLPGPARRCHDDKACKQAAAA